MADDRREIHAVENRNHRKVKRARDSTDGVDSISSLPDAILQHIFSQIPMTKYAVRTSVLSKRWRHVWSETPSLDIDCNRYDPDSVYETLARYYSSPKITTFKLSISTKEMANQIDRFIHFATSRDAEKLSLELGYSDDVDYHFPEFLFTSCSLEQLFIESGTIDTIAIAVSWTWLKTLSLRGCVLSDEACAKILSGSPLLECLTLFCNKLERLDLSDCLMLKRLDVEVWGGMMHIVAPRISFLRLTHCDMTQCELVDVSSLTEANVNISNRLFLLYDSLQVLILETLDKFQNVEKLTLGGTFCLQILSLAVLRGVPFPTFKVEALTLETAIYPSIVPGVAKLLQNSPRLKTIRLDTVDSKMLEESRLTNYLRRKGLDTRQCWEPKDLDDSSLSEPELMSSVMKFLLKINGGDWYTVGSYTFSKNKNYVLSRT